MVETTIAQGDPIRTRPAQPRELEELERLAAVMDTAFRVPLVNYRIGLDGLIGLIPGVGDAATLVPAGYILYRAKQMGVPNHLFLRMLANVLADATLGAVPLIGDVFDLVFKSNRRNVQMLRRHLERPQRDAAAAEVR